MIVKIVGFLFDFVLNMPSIVPLILLPLEAWGVYRIWCLSPGTQRTGRFAAAAVLTFGIFDVGMLLSLPRLELSFGPVGLALLGLSLIRLVIIAALTLPWRFARESSIQNVKLGLVLIWVFNVVLSGCTVYGFYYEPFNLTVGEVRVPGPAWFSERPLRIVQLSDLHVERTTRRERDIVAQVQALDPDIIVLTADFMNLSYTFDPVAQRDARDLFSQLHAPYGVYAVRAEGVDPPDVVSHLFEGLDITLLEDEVQWLSLPEGDLILVGVTYVRRERDREVFHKLMAQLPDETPKLLLYHTPDLIEDAAAEDIALYLAGHTHGGQIRMPLYGAIFTASAYGKRYEMGRYTLGETTLYVSRGLGMEGMGAPRARFLCPPEIVSVDWGAN